MLYGKFLSAFLHAAKQRREHKPPAMATVVPKDVVVNAKLMDMLQSELARPGHGEPLGLPCRIRGPIHPFSLPEGEQLRVLTDFAVQAGAPTHSTCRRALAIPGAAFLAGPSAASCS
jgi:hypothetical protein